MNKLHELAKLMRGAVSAGVIKQHSAEVEIIQWADTIDEALSAPPPPTSELVGHLRDRAEVDLHNSALLLEAADALADLALRLEMVAMLNEKAATRIAELERELYNMKGNTLIVGHLREQADQRAEAAESRVADLERELAETCATRDGLERAYMRRLEAAEARLAPFAERIKVLAGDVMRERDARMAVERRLADVAKHVHECEEVASGIERMRLLPPTCAGLVRKIQTTLEQALATPAQTEEGGGWTCD